MSTSGIKFNLKSHKVRCLITYAIISVFCFIFGYVYELFSHEVYTKYMTHMFLIPLIGGLFVFLIFYLFNFTWPDRFAFNMYNSSIATFTVASTIKGIFVIAGTNSVFCIVFWILGGILLYSSIIEFIVKAIKSKKKH